MQDFRDEFVPILDEWAHEVRPCFRVFTERRFRICEIAFQNYGGAVIERMRDRRGRVNPLKAIFC